MIISIWRSAHLSFALLASLFLLITSITGVILSFAPISAELSPYQIKDMETTTVADLIANLEGKYAEIIEVKIDENGFLQLSVVRFNGEYESFYADAKTGRKIGEIQRESQLFTTTRNLHRSIFLGKTGRFLIGLSSFLLILISLSGAVLVAKRQLKLNRYFSKVTRDNFEQYGHVVFGRLFLIVILIIGVTGTVLSMERFSILPKTEKKRTDFPNRTIAGKPVLKTKNFKIFKNTTLRDLNYIQFPFSTEKGDYFLVGLKDREIGVNQFNGDIIHQDAFGKMHEINQLTFEIHTGKGRVWWSVLLGCGSLGILFLMYSGFKMTWRRRQGKKSNRFTKAESAIVILFGSEGGQTAVFAKYLQQVLIQNKQKVYLDELSSYSNYPKMEHLIICTSTYGNGEAPANAKVFVNKFSAKPPKKPFNFTVLGFGSTDYPAFCEYANEVNALLAQEKTGREIIPYTKINKRNQKECQSWLNLIFEYYKINSNVFEKADLPQVKKATTKFEVVDRKESFLPDNNTIALELQASAVAFQSGDLLAIQISDEAEERFYSIGKSSSGNLLLGIRIHTKGLCSSFLSEQQVSSQISGRIQSNPHFHFPADAKQIIAICNGTGIVPFLGMAEENLSNTSFHLFWGGKSQQTFQLFADQTKQLLYDQKISSFHSAFSQEISTPKRYVQDLLEIEATLIAHALQDGTIFLICGSCTMRDGVLIALDQISQKHLKVPFEIFMGRGQIRMDCY